MLSRLDHAFVTDFCEHSIRAECEFAARESPYGVISSTMGVSVIASGTLVTGTVRAALFAPALCAGMGLALLGGV